ncbi:MULTISPECIES: SulP family inorganic anion transporter [Cyanophyceae]|uniref:Sodium-independent anion transporter n=2 Tax=Nodularia spumigena TaxID=70799 RepID=A0A161URW9_NODSP|nr:MULTISPECIES: SulP family inorganic anion transporter [Cyanophyceae]MDB9355476.1 SulP family inorganic anion transporter [Nodularia spumigena CS-587/03]KZL48563.1 sodium-independent anion transporter [Nodularia spumigena CENA596]MDB9321856.1 SulP family inorganic anion transporter [Nodularia spumigena CS-591/07A]MDB9332272.1 SulP family inorganic anion transporter [Nodularia spumigena CS-591/04]MDB9341233.1 SulP family inorganic anion transporter [Nodularia spumigena CS-589/07]
MQITNQNYFRNLQGDILGGLTAAVVALPMALAFGIASGAGASAGLWGAILVGLFAALFGGTPSLISEPTGPMTVIVTAVIAGLTANNPENGLAMAFTVVMMAGVFQIIFGVLRLGRYITMLPYNVISGFMTGIGVILIFMQIAPFLGEETPKGGVLGVLQNIPTLIANISPTETLLGVITLVILFFYPARFKKIVPPQLVALVIGTAISLIFFRGVEIRTIATIGEITPGLPNFQMPTFSPENLQLMFVNSVVLAIVGSIDCLLTCLVSDSLTRTEHKSNKELIGQGIANLITGLCGGIAGSGATTATVVNIQAGGRTPLSGISRALILLIVVLWAAPLTSGIPLAVLAGIVLKVGINIIDWGFLKRVHKISWKAAGIVYSVVLLTVFVDLMIAVAVGVFIANILTIERLDQLQSNSVKAITDADDQIVLNAEEKKFLDLANGRVLLFHLSGPMIFGVAKAIEREHRAIANYDVLIVDLSEVPVLGVTSSLAIESAIQEVIDAGREVIIVGATGKVKNRLEKLGIAGLIPGNHWMGDRLNALKEGLDLVQSKATL